MAGGRGADGSVPRRGQAWVSPHLGLTCVFPPSPRDCQKCPALLTGIPEVSGVGRGTLARLKARG